MKEILVKFYLFAVHTMQYIVGAFLVFSKLEKGKRVFLIGTPEHDNIGDHAIALAEEQFIRRYFNEYGIYEIPVDQWRKYALLIKLRIKNKDLVFITGGGNMGNVYMEDERLKRYVVRHLRNNLITILPQTVFYNNFGKELLKTKRIYSSHRNLIIVAREKRSMSLLQEYFPNNIILCCPDMVFFLDYKSSGTNAKECVGVCFRNDREAAINPSEKRKIVESLQKKYQISIFSTLNHASIDKDVREKIVFDKLNEISKYNLVVTDRLHGMVFSIVTSTPCMILPTESHKIISMMEWPEVREYVSYYKEDDIDSLLNSKSKDWDRMKIIHYFSALAETIKTRVIERN